MQVEHWLGKSRQVRRWAGTRDWLKSRREGVLLLHERQRERQVSRFRRGTRQRPG